MKINKCKPSALVLAAVLILLVTVSACVRIDDRNTSADIDSTAGENETKPAEDETTSPDVQTTGAEDETLPGDQEAESNLLEHLLVGVYRNPAAEEGLLPWQAAPGTLTVYPGRSAFFRESYHQLSIKDEGDGLRLSFTNFDYDENGIAHQKEIYHAFLENAEDSVSRLSIYDRKDRLIGTYEKTEDETFFDRWKAPEDLSATQDFTALNAFVDAISVEGEEDVLLAKAPIDGAVDSVQSLPDETVHLVKSNGYNIPHIRYLLKNALEENRLLKVESVQTPPKEEIYYCDHSVLLWTGSGSSFLRFYPGTGYFTLTENGAIHIFYEKAGEIWDPLTGGIPNTMRGILDEAEKRDITLKHLTLSADDSGAYLIPNAGQPREEALKTYCAALKAVDDETPSGSGSRFLFSEYRAVFAEDSDTRFGLNHYFIPESEWAFRMNAAGNTMGMDYGEGENAPDRVLAAGLCCLIEEEGAYYRITVCGTSW